MSRKAQLARIHIAKKELGLDDATYRSILERVVGKASAADCDEAGLELVLKEFTRLGHKHARHTRPKVQEDAKAQLSKIEALLADRKRDWAYGHALAKRICKVERIEWVPPNQLYKLIAALELDKKRRAKDGA